MSLIFSIELFDIFDILIKFFRDIDLRGCNPIFSGIAAREQLEILSGKLID